MDSSSQQQKQDGVMEVPEIHGDLLVELLDASLAAENAGHDQQLGSVSDVVDGDGDCWIIDDSQENYDIHAQQGCEDCGLELLPDFDEYGGGARLMRSPAAAPYAVFDDHDDTLEWAETADAAAMDPFTSACTGGWYMDGLVMAMAMEWEEQSGFPFEPCYGGGEAAGTAEQVYASPLWE